MQDGPHSIYLLDLLFDELSLYFTVVRKEVSTLLSLKSFFATGMLLTWAVLHNCNAE